MKPNKTKHAAGEIVHKSEDGKLSPLVAYVDGILKTDRPLLEKVINERIAGLVDAILSQDDVLRERLEEAKANPARLYGYFKNGSIYETREEATAAIVDAVFVFGCYLTALGEEIDKARAALDADILQYKRDHDTKRKVVGK